MSNLLSPNNNWWETNTFGSSTLPFGFSAPQDSYLNKGWEDLDGDLEMLLAIKELLTGERKSYWEQERLDWDRHVQKLLHEDCFHTRYRMPLGDFNALVELLGGAIVPNVVQSKRRSVEPIYPKMILGIGTRVLAGGNYDDIMNTFGISKSGFYYSGNKFLNAVLSCRSLDINLPTTPLQWEKIRKGFSSKSVNQVLKGCMGVLDGFFQPTVCPTAKEA
jgi:hypothetical protein